VKLDHSTLYQRWSLDFITDTLSDSRRLRILRGVDDFSRECLATVVDTSLSGVRVVRELERLTGERATPEVIVSDNGSERTSVALRWVPDRGLNTQTTHKYLSIVKLFLASRRGHCPNSAFRTS